MLPAAVVREAAKELNDLEPRREYTRWPQDDLFEYFNDGITQIAFYKKELITATVKVRLAAGQYQKLPAAYAQLIDFKNNINGVGFDGYPISVGDYESIRASKTPCPDDTIAYRVEGAAIDGREPNVFYVDPPVPAGTTHVISILVQFGMPLAKSINTETFFPGGDIELWKNCIMDYMLYRAWMKDTESQSSVQRAQIHFTSFNTALGLKVKFDSIFKAAKDG